MMEIEKSPHFIFMQVFYEKNTTHENALVASKTLSDRASRDCFKGGRHMVSYIRD